MKLIEKGVEPPNHSFGRDDAGPLPILNACVDIAELNHPIMSRAHSQVRAGEGLDVCLLDAKVMH